MEGLLRAGRPPLRRSDWTPEDCARFVAHRDVEFLAGLARNKAALRAARRLRLFDRLHSCSSASSAAMSMGVPPAPPVDSSGAASFSPNRQRPARRARPSRLDGSKPQPHPPTAAAAVVAGRDAPVAAPAPEVAGTSLASPNARKRRSAARSARHHAARRLALRNRMIMVTFIAKLRRRVVLRHQEAMTMTPPGRSPDTKRDRDERSDGESSLSEYSEYSEQVGDSEGSPVGPFASMMAWEAPPAAGSNCDSQSGPSTPHCSLCCAPFPEESATERAARHRRPIPHFCLECEALSCRARAGRAAPASPKPKAHRRGKGRAGGRARVT